jgi:uncharacterized protein YndB with AHSA1/START domain
MVDRTVNEPAATRHCTTLERQSERELDNTRTFDAPVPRVFEAWTTPGQFQQWWVPKSCGVTLLSVEQDVRIGGRYRLEFAHPEATTPMAFFGSYVDVVPNARLVWTNEESADGAVTTVTFEETDGKTQLVMRERYPSRQALDTAIVGMDEAMPETFAQLEAFLAARRAGADSSDRQSPG